MSALANMFVSRGNWRLALGILETMGEEACAPLGQSEGSINAGVGVVGGGGARSSACRVEVLSRIGRIFLQFGALKDAEVYFRRAEEAVPLEREGGNTGHVGDNARVSKQCFQFRVDAPVFVTERVPQVAARECH